MQTGSTLARVRPVKGARGWEAVEPGSTRVLVRAKDQRSAIRGARTRLAQGGRLEVLDADGQLIVTIDVPGPRQGPWWYLQSSPLWWFIAASLLVQPVLRLLDRSTSGLLWWMSVVTGVFALMLVAALIYSRHRDGEIPLAEVGDDSVQR